MYSTVNVLYALNVVSFGIVVTVRVAISSFRIELRLSTISTDVESAEKLMYIAS